MTRGMFGGLVLVAALAGGHTVAAQDRPTILPTRDVAITYRATGPVQGQQQQRDLKVAFTSGGRLMRVEEVGGQMSGGYVIVDHSTQRMTMAGNYGPDEYRLAMITQLEMPKEVAAAGMGSMTMKMRVEGKRIGDCDAGSAKTVVK